MGKITLYGEYYMVGMHKEKEEFLKDVKKSYAEWGYGGEIKQEDIKTGIVYGGFESPDSYFSGETSGKGRLVINGNLEKEFGPSRHCFYIDMEDIEE